ncbi:MAG: hypothetical protein AABY83_06985 [Pseudomonadota bacterium]
MNHLQAALFWLVNTFNALWPMALAAFAGSAAAFGYQGLKDYRQRLHKQIEDIALAVAILRLQLQELSRAQTLVLRPWLEGRKRLALIPAGWIVRLPEFDHARVSAALEARPDLLNALLMWQHWMAEIGALCRRRIQLETMHVEYAGRGDGAAQDRQEQFEKIIKATLEQVAQQVDNSLKHGADVLSQITAYGDERKKTRPLPGVEILPWGFLAIAMVLSGIFFFSEWVIGDVTLAEAGVDLQTLAAVLFASALYASLAFCCADSVFIVRSLIKKERTLSIYFAAWVVGMQPMIYLLWLQAMA